MSIAHTIQQNIETFVQYLKINNILDKLLEKDVITQLEYRDVKRSSNRPSDLMDIIIQKPENQQSDFAECLRSDPNVGTHMSLYRLIKAGVNKYKRCRQMDMIVTTRLGM